MLPAVLHGGGSIYRLTPCDAATAWKHQPRNAYSLPAPVRAILPPVALPKPEDHQAEHLTADDLHDLDHDDSEDQADAFEF